MKRKRTKHHLSILLLGAAVFSCGGLLLVDEPESSAAAAPEAPSAPSAAATTKDPDKGKAVYEKNCLACHAADGRGAGSYPSLVSERMKKNLGTYDKAYEYISRNMPQNAPGSLREDEYKAVADYVLSLNGTASGFSDIDRHWARKEIAELMNQKYIDGFTDLQTGRTEFKPDQSITRAEFIRYFVKAKKLFLSNTAASEFTDVSGSQEDKVYIITAVEYGLINGYPDQTFRPANHISRAEIAAIIARSEMLKPDGESIFSDVPPGFWAGDAIRALQQAHLFDGYEDGTFRPDQYMTRAEAAAVIYRLVHPVA
ncbi:S-layer homology domain-containing protein [Paenibacillus piri]|nr:S-layer homology domain-containing protein [Paenibacillus piri]